MPLGKSVTVQLAGDYPIYKLVNGSLVRIESRDPSRRYALTTEVQTGLTYYREFTDSEEAAADADRARWEADAPEREAEAKRVAEEAKKFKNSLRYELRLVAFIDILGWIRAICASAETGASAVEALGMALAQLQGVTRFTNSLSNLMPDKEWPGEPLMTNFSDSVVFTAKDDQFGKDHLLQTLYVLSSNLIPHGYLLRGGIVRGEILHKDGLVFGPALIEAYLLERDVASSPRIILSKELSREWGAVANHNSMPWRESNDGHLFFNFLPPYMGNPFFANNSDLWQGRLGPIRELIITKAQEYKDDDSEDAKSVYAKYIWLAEYFDEICDEFPGSGIEKVRGSL